MKDLTSFILEKHYKETLKGNTSDYEIYNRFIDELFENKNDITKYWVDSFYVRPYIGEDTWANEDWIDFYIYEMLNNYVTADKLIDKLQNKFKNDISNIVKVSSKDKFSMIKIFPKDINKFEINKHFIEFCNQSYYEPIVSKSRDSITLKPINGEEITQDVHKLDYIYHITEKYVWENFIKNKGLVPRCGESSKIGRIFFNSEFNNDKGATFSYFKFRYTKDDGIILRFKQAKQGYVVLKIDVSKLNKNMKFFKDSGGSNGFWTHEYIPPYAIVDATKIDMKRYKDKHLEN